MYTQNHQKKTTTIFKLVKRADGMEKQLLRGEKREKMYKIYEQSEKLRNVNDHINLADGM